MRGEIANSYLSTSSRAFTVTAAASQLPATIVTGARRSVSTQDIDWYEIRHGSCSESFSGLGPIAAPIGEELIIQGRNLTAKKQETIVGGWRR
jgi:hypothetical protein